MNDGEFAPWEKPSTKKFPKKRRLLKRQDFLNAERRGKKIRGKCLTVVWVQREAGLTRVGLIVSRKVGNAVVRNRLKRLMREYFRNHCEQLPCSLDLVFIARKGAVNLVDNPSFLREIQGLVANLKRV